MQIIFLKKNCEGKENFVLSASVGGLNMGDVIIQLLFLLLVILLVIGIVSLIVMCVKRNKKISQLEEKIDKLQSEKDK